jgi:hypothetical protein
MNTDKRRENQHVNTNGRRESQNMNTDKRRENQHVNTNGRRES